MSHRIVCQFSCGAASAVATKMTLAQYSATHDVQIINAFIKNEHPDNRRFLTDCEQWLAREITVLRDTKYGADTVQVFRRVQFMKGPYGAPCTRILKRKLLATWEKRGDVLVLGYTVEEEDRFDDFVERNPDRPVIAPLIEAGLGKEDCKAMVLRASIRLPYMYELGYDNANCIGCVKGGEGYWRAIREDFPVEFEELAQVQEEIGPDAYLHRNRKTNERFSLRELGDGPVRRNEKMPSCSFFCEIAEQVYSA
ncbi:hypothetical protein H0A66_03850 [Alcaligenaceae bacterium]|nr:hypothetical protein [Alcaligenaceae bacterium]